MLFNRYVLALLITAIVSLTSLALVLTRLDPIADEFIAVPLFFGSLFFSASSIFTLAGYAFRLGFYQDELSLNHFNVSLRQGIILGFSLCAFMGLQLMRTLTWWNALLIGCIALLVELYFVARD